MAIRNQLMSLAPQQLNDLDESLLDLLYEGRVTPALAQTLLAEREIVEVSRQYINQRLGRLAEHEHTRNIEGSGVYELVADPRSGGDAIAEEHFKRLSVALSAPITIGDVVYEDGDKHLLESDDENDDDPAVRTDGGPTFDETREPPNKRLRTRLAHLREITEATISVDYHGDGVYILESRDGNFWNSVPAALHDHGYQIQKQLGETMYVEKGPDERDRRRQ